MPATIDRIGGASQDDDYAARQAYDTQDEYLAGIDAELERLEASLMRNRAHQLADPGSHELYRDLQDRWLDRYSEVLSWR